MKRVLIAIVLSGFAMGACGIASAQETQTSPDSARQKFDAIDTNRDGVLTLEEWKASGHRERGFDFIDANHDGKVTPDELRAAAAKFGH